MLIFFSIDWLKLSKFHGQITVACCYWIRLWAFMADINQVMGSWILT